MTITQFKKAFEELKKKGWVESRRRGPTGVGHTLEQLIGLEENNIALPDLGKVELKAHRAKSSSMITLFTFNRKAWKMKPLDAVRKYGTPDKNGRLGLLSKEICNECGRSVRWGSGLFVNRVIDFNDTKARIDMGKPFPDGDFICSECEEGIVENFKPNRTERCWK